MNDDTIHSVLNVHVNDLRALTYAVRAVQQSSLFHRIPEITQWNNCQNLADKPSDLSVITSDVYDQIREFIEDSENSAEPFSHVFYNRYGIHHNQITEIECDTDDNHDFWDGFIEDLNGENAPETTLLAFAIIVTVAEINKEPRNSIPQPLQTMKISENKRFLDLLIKFYVAEIKYQQSEDIGFSLINHSGSSGRLEDEDARINVINHYFPPDRDFRSYAAQNIPDILLKVGDFLKITMQNDRLNQICPTLQWLNNCNTPLPEAEIIDFSSHRKLRKTPNVN